MTSLSGVRETAKKELADMGPMTLPEKKLLVVFILAILGFMLGGQIQAMTGLDFSTQTIGFLFMALVLLLDVMDWNDVISAKGGWSVFVWFGAFFGVATALANAGFYTWLAKELEKVLDLSHVNGLLVMFILVIISLLVRYFFVSNSAFVASVYPVLFTLALNSQANIKILALLLAFFSPLGALLTHYGNGAGLVIFAFDYVPQKDFWRIGTIMVVVALFIIFLIGLPYWKLIGLW